MLGARYNQLFTGPARLGPVQDAAMRHVSRSLVLVLTVLIVAAWGADAFAGGKKGSGGDVSVKGYYRKDGTYVQPHKRSAPDSSPYNNYGMPGNYNPNTGTITPGKPDTYLERYYQKKGLPKTGTDD
jgi:hypothetical protein